ncbi:MAG TPA: hypothetical protein VLS94_08955 [Fusibacter sp.]|nr:hypothetical protein [Fusibacter sp.]
MPLTPRIKKYTDYSYLVTNPPSEDAVRSQMDGAVQEVFDTVQAKFDSHFTEVASELISFERDVTIAGDQIISGFSRKPKTLIINAVVTGSLKQSKGQLSTNGQRVLYTIGNNGQFLSANNLSITINDTVGNETRGVVVINTNNTITVTWTKLGTGGTGTARINVIAFYHGED